MQTLEWVTPEGDVFPLNEVEGVVVERSIQGRWSPPLRLVEDTVPYQPGQLLRDVQHDAAAMTIPIKFAAADATTFYTTMRTWAWRMDATRGNSRLRVTPPDGTPRERVCVVTAGLELDEAQGLIVDGWCKTALTVVAHYPYWLSTVDELETWSATAPPQWFPLSFPFRVGSGNVLGTRTVTVLGEKPAQPVWVVHGPGAGLSLRNITTGRTLAWDGVLGPTETLTIDTRGPALSTTPRRVYRNSGADEFGSLSKYDMWPLLAGGQEIEVTLTGADETSSVECHYRPNYLTD